MTQNAKIRNLREGYKPKPDELRKGYPVTQPVDIENLKIPKNLGDAAVTPSNNSNTTPKPAKSEKE